MELEKLIQEINVVLNNFNQRIIIIESNQRILEDAFNRVHGEHRIKLNDHEGRIDLLENVRRTYDGTGKLDLK